MCIRIYIYIYVFVHLPLFLSLLYQLQPPVSNGETEKSLI